MQTSESPTRDFLRLIVWYPLRWLLLAMPIRAEIALLLHMGDLHYCIAKEKKRVLQENLQRAGISADEKVQREHIRTYFRIHYLDQLFPIIFPKFNLNSIEKLVTISGVANLDRGLQRQKGVILVHGHFGPVHLPLVALALMGYPIKQIGNPSDKDLSWIGRNVAFRLRMFYENLIPAEILKTTSFLRPVFTALKHNKVIMTTGDGSGNADTFGRYGLFKFLGQPVSLPLGPAILAQKTGAALLPVTIVPGDKKLFTIQIGEEILSRDGGETGVIDCTKQFATQLQRAIQDCPGFWHFLDRFRPGQLIRPETDHNNNNNPTAAGK